MNNLKSIFLKLEYITLNVIILYFFLNADRNKSYISTNNNNSNL